MSIYEEYKKCCLPFLGKLIKLRNDDLYNTNEMNVVYDYIYKSIFNTSNKYKKINILFSRARLLNILIINNSKLQIDMYSKRKKVAAAIPSAKYDISRYVLFYKLLENTYTNHNNEKIFYSLCNTFYTEFDIKRLISYITSFTLLICYLYVKIKEEYKTNNNNYDSINNNDIYSLLNKCISKINDYGNKENSAIITFDNINNNTFIYDNMNYVGNIYMFIWNIVYNQWFNENPISTSRIKINFIKDIFDKLEKVLDTKYKIILF